MSERNYDDLPEEDTERFVWGEDDIEIIDEEDQEERTRPAAEPPRD